MYSRVIKTLEKGEKDENRRWKDRCQSQKRPRPKKSSGEEV